MSTAARRAREKQQRRESIIDAAEKLFFSQLGCDCCPDERILIMSKMIPPMYF